MSHSLFLTCYLIWLTVTSFPSGVFMVSISFANWHIAHFFLPHLCIPFFLVPLIILFVFLWTRISIRLSPRRYATMGGCWNTVFSLSDVPWERAAYVFFAVLMTNQRCDGLHPVVVLTPAGLRWLYQEWWQLLLQSSNDGDRASSGWLFNGARGYGIIHGKQLWTLWEEIVTRREHAATPRARPRL